jgi:thiamine pyrophosphokinase
MKPCIFVAAGDISGNYLKALMQMNPLPFIFAIDGGYGYLKKNGIKPDIAIGDFDSLGFIPDDPGTLVFPVRKDKPDTMLAIDRAKELKFDTAFVLGAFGGKRLDHTISKLQQLFYALPELRVVYLDDATAAFALADETALISDDALSISGRAEDKNDTRFTMPKAVLKLLKPTGCYLSIFTQSSAVADLCGTAYDGEDIGLTCSFPLGVSNEVMACGSTVSVRGEVIVMLSKKD